MRLKIVASHPVQYHVPFYRALVKAGIDVDVLYFHQGTAGRIAVDPEFGIPLQWDVDLLSGYTSHFLCPDNPVTVGQQLKLAPRLLSWALREPRVPVLFMSWALEAMWAAWLARCLARFPVMVLSETTSESFDARPKPAWRVRLLRFLLQKTQGVLYIGQRNRRFYERMGVRRERLFFAPYSIDNVRFSSEAARVLPHKRQLRIERGLDPDLPTYLFCGKLIEKKRPRQLLAAFEAAGLTSTAQLVFVGEGPLRADLESVARERGLGHVRVAGFLNQTEMPLAYVLGDILCLLSGPDETWGLVVNEAMSCGLPAIVSTTVGCAPDLVQESNGWVVPLDDQGKLAAVLRQSYLERARWSAMGAAGRTVVARYTFDAMSRGVVEALMSVVGRGSP